MIVQSGVRMCVHALCVCVCVCVCVCMCAYVHGCVSVYMIVSIINLLIHTGRLYYNNYRANYCVYTCSIMYTHNYSVYTIIGSHCTVVCYNYVHRCNL